MKPPRHGFDSGEFALRMNRAQELLRKHELDGIVVTTPPNFRYFSGFDSQFWESPTRPWFLVVPALGGPRAVIPEIGAPEMRRTHVDRIHSWPAPRPSDDGTSLLASVIEELPRRFGRVGFELGREHSLRMPVMQFLELREQVREIELVNGSPCIWEIRMQKTENEISRIRHICEVASSAYADVPTLVKIGDSERDAARILRLELTKKGADSVPFLPAISGPGGVPQIVCGPRDRILETGDILFFDTGSTFDGYYCDFDRNYAVGAVSDAAKRAHEAMWQATEAGLGAAVVGATAEQVHRVMAKIIEEAGSIGNNVGRLGHGLGMQLTEPPSNMPGDVTILRANMVLTLEPGIEYEPGKMIVHEENVVVRESGPELLTRRAPRELPVIGS